MTEPKKPAVWTQEQAEVFRTAAVSMIQRTRELWNSQPLQILCATGESEHGLTKHVPLIREHMDWTEDQASKVGDALVTPADQGKPAPVSKSMKKRLSAQKGEKK